MNERYTIAIGRTHFVGHELVGSEILEEEEDDQRQGRHVQIVLPRLERHPHVRIAQRRLPGQASPRVLRKVKLLK